MIGIIDVKNQLNLNSMDKHFNMIWVVYVKNQRGLTSMDKGNFPKIVALFLRYNHERFLIIYAVFLFVALGKDVNH
jgi:hypothetical protein